MTAQQLKYRPKYLLTLSSSLANNGLGAPAGNYSLTFADPIVLDGPYEIGATQYSIWYTLQNISAARGNNTLRIGVNTVTPVWTTITIPDGLYSIDDLNLAIKTQMTLNSLDPDKVTLSVIEAQFTSQFEIYYDAVDPTETYMVDLSVSNIGNIIGFKNAAPYPGLILTPDGTNFGIFPGNVQANITAGFSAFVINLPGIVNQSTSYNSSGQCSAIYQSTFQVDPGYNQGVDITYPKYVSVGRQMINQITVQITDQDGVEIVDFGQANDYQNNASTLTLELRPIFPS